MSLAPNQSVVRSLFDAAMDLPADEREAWLRRVCTDSTIVCEVLELIAANGDGDGLTASGSRIPHVQQVGERMPVIRGFTVESKLAQGGTARVYKGISNETGASVAIKVIAEGASRASLERFRQECRVLARLNHDGVVRLHETGVTVDGDTYLVMDFIDGVTIDKWAHQPERTTVQRIDATLQVLDALKHSHEIGVIHRDLKPHNILVDAAGRARLVDFGVARLMSDGRRTGFHTETGNLVGTFAYMSPEQADGSSDQITSSTDLYQLAVVLYEMISGSLPYDIRSGGAMALLKAILFDARVPLAVAAPDVDARLAQILDDALSLDATKRPANAQDFADSLRTLLSPQGG